jgi:aldose 1-epimerase
MLLVTPRLQLRHGPYEADISPGAGARVTRLCWRSGAGRVSHLLVPLHALSFDEQAWPKAGAFPMLPYTNRLPNSGIFSQACWAAVAPGSPPGRQHGLGHRLAWQVDAHSQSSAQLSYRHTLPSPDWPWCFDARITFALTDEGLTVTSSLSNRGDEPMPGAIGWHPYHPCHPLHPQSDGQPATPRFEAAHQVPMNAAGACLPRPAWTPLQAGVTPALTQETSAFEAWAQQASVQVDEAVQACISAQGWDHLVVHRPPAGGYVCLEPVSVLPGEIGQGGQIDQGSQGGLLQPGQTVSAYWRCAAQPASADT